MEQPYEEMVAQFMARFLDLPLENISGSMGHAASRGLFFAEPAASRQFGEDTF